MSDGISPAEPGTAIPEEAPMVLLTEKCMQRGCARKRFSELTDDQNTHWHVRRGAALVPLAAAVPLLGLAAQADTDRDAARRALDAELVRRTVAAEAERDALRVQLDQARAALAAVEIGQQQITAA